MQNFELILSNYSEVLFLIKIAPKESLPQKGAFGLGKILIKKRTPSRPERVVVFCFLKILFKIFKKTKPPG